MTRYPVYTLSGIAMFVFLLDAGLVAAQTQHPFIGAPEDQALIDEVLDGWFPAAGTGNIIYVAPPDGDTVGTGIKADPFRDIIGVIDGAVAGDWIYLAPGVYRMNEIRDLWGYETSVLHANADGERGNPIILTTDPEEFDPAAGRQAVIDFEYGNQNPGARATCFGLSHDYWLIENLEMKNIWSRGIWLGGYDNVIRNCHFHHLDTDGTNNEGFVFIVASGRPTNNVIMGNHMHHIGIIDDYETGEIADYGGVNVACVYTENRQSYDSDFPDHANNPSPQDYLDAKLTADSHAYLYNNLVHHAKIGLATKTIAEGPYFFLSNIIHDVETGIRTAYRYSIVRNNIIYPGDEDLELGTGIAAGQFVTNYYLGNVGNAAEMEISHNTVVGANLGLNFRGGWSSVCHSNLVVREDESVHIHRNQYYWYDNGEWPGIRGEYSLADLTDQHPYYDIMPNYLQAMAGDYKKLSISNNCYTKTPEIAPADFTQPDNDITGAILDDEYEVIDLDQVDALFTDPSGDDYTRDFDGGLYEECGSRIGAPGANADADADGDADADADADTDADADADTDSDSDTDGDSDIDGDTDADADSAIDAGESDDTGGDGSCGCSVTGAPRTRTSLYGLLRATTELRGFPL